MLPIPLTVIGIIPGHWLLDAEFTATSMIGFIALAGIEVRNSILFDPIFQGMAISLLFGAITSVTLTMLTLPLRCIAARRAFVPVPEESAETAPADDRPAASAP